MGRKKKSSPAEDLLDLVSLLPWWGGVVLAIASYFVLHALSTQVPALPMQPGQIGQMVSRMLLQSFAYYGQYILPMLCFLGAAISAFKQRHRHTLVANVVASNAFDALDGVTWREFEMLVGEAFRLKGYQIVETGGNGADGGVDIILRKENEKFFVQCKQWKAYKVGVEVARELYGVMAAQGAAGGFIVTSGRFTEPAKEFAKGRNLKLVEGQALLRLLQPARAACSAQTNTDIARAAEIGLSETTAAPFCPVCAKPMVRRIAKQGKSIGNAFWGCTGFPACKGIRHIDDHARPVTEVSP